MCETIAASWVHEACTLPTAERENACCSFFRVEFSDAGVGLVMDVSVPAGHAAVLEASSALVRPSVMAEWLRSGAVADRAGVNQQTFRSYER